MKPSSTILLAAYVVPGSISYSVPYLPNAALSAIMCLYPIPLIQWDLPFAGPSVNRAQYPVLIHLHIRFQVIIEESFTSITFAFNMKRSEIAVHDLNTLVQSYFAASACSNQKLA